MEMSISHNISTAPITMFVYNRLHHTQLMVEALQNNELASDSDVFIFSDGPKIETDRKNIERLRTYLKTITGFKSVTVVERSENQGCANSIVNGINEIVNRFGQIIIVEDDIVTSPFFLRYMNEALNYYRDVQEVICISGYLYPVKQKLPETFFVRGADNWGWATWKRGWSLYESDVQKLLDELEGRQITHDFNFNGAYDFTQMLRDQIAGKLDTWDIQWYASAFLQNKLTLYPGRSLVKNIGFDDSGTHCGVSDLFQARLSDTPVIVSAIAVEESSHGRKAIQYFHKYPRGGPVQEFAAKLLKKIRKYTNQL